MTRNPASTLKLLDSALQHLLAHVEAKKSFSLTIVDLLHVSNFKGGNASITEPQPALGEKLQSYSQHLVRLAQRYGQRMLQELSDRELMDVQRDGTDFLLLTQTAATHIRGFGPSYASALLFAHFPNLFPVLDRRVLNGARIPVQLTSKGQVRDIETHYAKLLQAFHSELRRTPDLSLRDLDKRWFVVPLPQST
jgi:hypothetical protein